MPATKEIARWRISSVPLAPQRERRSTSDEALIGESMLRNWFCVFAVLVVAYSTQSVETQTGRAPSVVLYEGARLIAGDGSAPIDNSAFLVENGTITKVGRKGDVSAPGGARRVNLTGKTVMPT